MRDDGRRRYPKLPRTVGRVRADVDEEIQFDLEMRKRELVAQGLSDDEARRQALREFGDLDVTRSYCVSMDTSSERSARWIDRIADTKEDFKLTWRGVRRTPMFALVVVLTFALGIGINTAVFSVVRRMLIDRLPYRTADQLVRVYGPTQPGGHPNAFLTPNELVDLAQAPSIAGVAAFGWLGSATYVGEERNEVWRVAAVTPNFFTLLGSTSQIGRTFDARDTSSGTAASVVISHTLWQRVFGGDPNVIGRFVELDGRRQTIVGVMSPDFVSPTFVADVWTLLDLRASAIGPVQAQRQRAFRGLARLRDGATVAQSASDIATIGARWGVKINGSPTLALPRLVPLRTAMLDGSGIILLAVMGAALLVLVITCINVAGLFLSRATARRREMAVRAALGAGRGRLIRQLLTESGMYGLVGGMAGVGLAFGTRGVLGRIVSESLPQMGPIGIDMIMLMLCLVISIACGLAAGVLPAIAATSVDLKRSLGESGRSASTGSDKARLRLVLVTAQIALAVVLMIGAGLLTRSFNALTRVGLGYSADRNVVTFAMEPPESMPTDLASRGTFRNAFYADVLARIHALPGVVSVGLTTIGPWNGPSSVRPMLASMTSPDSIAPPALYMTATQEYFDAVGTRVLRGRSISSGDRWGTTPVALISESVARRLFPQGNAIGSQITFEAKGPGGSQGQRSREIVGIVEDIRERATGDLSPAVYVSDWQEGLVLRPTIVVRTKGDAKALVPQLQALVRQVSRRSPLMYPRTLREVLEHQVAPQELSMQFFALFAVVALTLASLGIYAVVAYMVIGRTRELGIRIALGATRANVISLVLRRGLVAAIVGSACGLGLAALGTRLIQGLIFGISVHDVITFVIVPAALLLVATAACLIPALSATRIAPTEALATE